MTAAEATDARADVGALDMSGRLARIDELRDLILEHVPEMEQRRSLPPAVIDALRSIRCFRMLVPASHGGDEISFEDSMRVLSALGRIDGSTAWSVMVAAETPFLACHLERSMFDEVYADGPDMIGAGVLAPIGRAHPSDGGYVVSGEWPFATGCRSATWIAGHCLVVDPDDPSLFTGARMVVLPASEWEVLDTWHTLGMRGTGSSHVALREREVPARLTFDMFADPPCVPSPVFRLPVYVFFPMHIAAVAAGIARGAVDDIITLAATKQSTMSMEALGTSPVFHNRLGEAASRVGAIDAALAAEARRAGETVEHDAIDDLGGYQLQALAAWATAESVAIVEMMFHLAGGTSVYESHQLQRRLRDIHTLHQHRVVAWDVFTTFGSMLMSTGA